MRKYPWFVYWKTWPWHFWEIVGGEGSPGFDARDPEFFLQHKRSFEIFHFVVFLPSVTTSQRCLWELFTRLMWVLQRVTKRNKVEANEYRDLAVFFQNPWWSTLVLISRLPMPLATKPLRRPSLLRRFQPLLAPTVSLLTSLLLSTFTVSFVVFFFFLRADRILGMMNFVII